VLTLEVASFNVRFGGGLVRDRYIFYLAPIFAIAFAAASPRGATSWKSSPVGVLMVGFAAAPLPIFDKLNVDAPVSIIEDTAPRGRRTYGARIFLVVVSLVAAAWSSRRASCSAAARSCRWRCSRSC